jgi:tripartite-type tricarboxylate transporter receptor subunit TctC
MAQASYPEKPVTLVVPFSAGGSTDLAARAIADAIATHLGQSVVVVNKPGASGAVAVKGLIDSPPDGYTLLMASIGPNAILPAVSATLPFQYDNMTPVARTQVVPTVLVVRKDAPWKSVQEIFKTAREKPGTLRASTAGIGTLHDLGVQILVKMTGAPPRSIITIPYKGGAEAETALVGGHVDLTFTNLIAVIGHIKNGTVKALAVVPPTPGRRISELPEIPTFAEAGLAGMDIIGWKGVIGPPKLSAAVVAKWEAALQKVIADPAWKAKIEKLGDAPAYQSGKEFGDFIRREYGRYSAIAKELNIVVGK